MRRLRMSRGISQAGLAAAAGELGGEGFHQASVSAWEAGTRTPDSRQLAILLGVLGATDSERLEALNLAANMGATSVPAITAGDARNPDDRTDRVAS